MDDSEKYNGLGVVWIGFQDRESRIKDFISKYAIRKNVAFDAGDAVAKKYGVRYGAGVVVIDGNGIVRARISKGFSERQLREALNKVPKIKAGLNAHDPNN